MPKKDGLVTFALGDEVEGSGMSEAGVIATVTFKSLKKQPSIVRLTDNTMTSSLELPDTNNIGLLKHAQLTLPETSPTPAPTPSNLPAPDKPTVNVNCEVGWFGAIRWGGLPHPQTGFKVEIATNNKFNGVVFSKSVETTSTGMGNMNFTPENGTKYFVRVSNGKFSPVSNFVYDCSSPTPRPSNTPRPTPTPSTPPKLTQWVCERKCDVKSKLPYYPFNEWTGDDIKACKKGCDGL